MPSWRATKDVTIKADIIEEITRVYGYDNFKITTTKAALAPVMRTAGNNDDRWTKDLLVQRYGMHEVHSYIWCDAKKYKDLNIEIEDNVRVINAMTPDHTVLRRSMVPTMITYVNENKAYANDFGVFEIARVINGSAKTVCAMSRSTSALRCTAALRAKRTSTSACATSWLPSAKS